MILVLCLMPSSVLARRRQVELSRLSRSFHFCRQFQHYFAPSRSHLPKQQDSTSRTSRRNLLNNKTHLAHPRITSTHNALARGATCGKGPNCSLLHLYSLRRQIQSLRSCRLCCSQASEKVCSYSLSPSNLTRHQPEPGQDMEAHR
jgi:hypothetical protein